MDHLFTSSALCAVSSDGRVSLPAFICRTLERRSDSSALMIGRHMLDPCLSAWDPGHSSALHADHERRRLTEEGSAAPDAQYVRARRTFGLVEQADWGPSGECRLSEMMRHMGAIEKLALFVGAGATFEIWNPLLALESDDEDLRELAAWRLENSLPPTH